MSLTISKMLSGALLLIAVGASLPLAGMVYVSFAFSGSPRTPSEWVISLVAFTLWIVVAATWKFPRAAYIVFMALYMAALAWCTSRGAGIGECFRALVFPTVSAMALTVNVALAVLWKRGRLSPRASLQS